MLILVTRPQEYNNYNFSILGGVFQKEGCNQVVSELSRLLCSALFFGVELLEIPDCPKKIILMHNTYMAQKNGGVVSIIAKVFAGLL